MPRTDYYTPEWPAIPHSPQNRPHPSITICCRVGGVCGGGGCARRPTLRYVPFLEIAALGMRDLHSLFGHCAHMCQWRDTEALQDFRLFIFLPSCPFLPCLPSYPFLLPFTFSSKNSTQSINPKPLHHRILS